MRLSIIGFVFCGVWLVVAFLLVACLPLPAEASFSPYECTPCNGDTAFEEVAYSFRAYGSKSAANWAVPINRMFYEGNYLDRVRASRIVVANSRVARIGVFNSFLETDWFADSILFGVDGYLDEIITGDAPNGFGWSVSRVMNTSTAGGIVLQFSANNPDPDAASGYVRIPVMSITDSSRSRSPIPTMSIADSD